MTGLERDVKVGTPRNLEARQESLSFPPSAEGSIQIGRVQR